MATAKKTRTRAANGGEPSRAEVIARVDAVCAQIEGVDATMTVRHDGLQRYLEEKFSNVEEKIDAIGGRVLIVEQATKALSDEQQRRKGARAAIMFLLTLIGGAFGGFLEWVRHGGRTP